MASQGKVRALLATARIANVPSVVSNVWVGIAIAAFFQRWEHPGSVWADALLLPMAGVLLYIGGNFLNDWHDREWDVKNRPERALPTGLFSPATYLVLAIVFVLSGILLAFAADPKSGLAAAAIAASIVVYTIWHKKAVWPVLPMGLCRALLPVMGFLAFATFQDQPGLAAQSGLDLPAPNRLVTLHALALLIYIAGLSLGARYESSPNPSKAAPAISKVALVGSGVLAAWLWIVLSFRAGVIGFLPFGFWMAVCLTKYRRPIPVHVSALLAGIPLIDWIALLACCLLQPIGSYPPALQPYLHVCLLLPPAAFFTGRLLQRVAPAT